MTERSGQVALVTGSARAIGRLIALRYAAVGADLVINYAHGETAATGYPMPGYTKHVGGKVAPEYLVRVLAHEVGGLGVTVNGILPAGSGTVRPVRAGLFHRLRTSARTTTCASRWSGELAGLGVAGIGQGDEQFLVVAAGPARLVSCNHRTRFAG